MPAILNDPSSSSKINKYLRLKSNDPIKFYNKFYDDLTSTWKSTRKALEAKTGEQTEDQIQTFVIFKGLLSRTLFKTLMTIHDFCLHFKPCLATL